MKNKLLYLVFIVLVFTSCYDKNNTILYETVDGKSLSLDPRRINKEFYSLTKGCYVVELKKDIKSLNNMFGYKTNLKKIIVPACINSISNYEFKDCSNLIYIELPSKVKIGNEAFNGCVNLEKIILPTELESISTGTFSQCSKLDSVLLPEGLTSIEDYAFSGCSTLSYVALPQSLTSIGNYAFSGCANISNITLPKKLEKVGNNAFDGCNNLNRATIECKRIGDYFKNIRSLKEIIINNTDSVCEISVDAFRGTEWYDNQEDGLVYYDNLLLGCKGNSLPDTIIIKDCTIMPKALFKNKCNIKYIELPNSIKHIQDSIFYDCKNLENIKMPNSIHSIGDCSFYGCSSIKYINIPNGVKDIGSKAFAECNNLQTIELPDTMNKIGYKAFYNCSNLTKIEFPDTITRIWNDAFQGCYKLSPELKMRIRINSLNNGKVICFNTNAKVPYLIFWEGDSVCCEKYPTQGCITEILYKEGMDFMVVKNVIKNMNETLVHKTEKDSISLGILKNIFCLDNKYLVFTTQKYINSIFNTQHKKYLANISTPGTLYEIDDWSYENNTFEASVIGSSILWELPGFHEAFLNYDANAYYFFNRGGGVPYFDYTIYFDKNCKIKKTDIILEGKSYPISKIGTPEMTLHYNKIFKELIETCEGSIPQFIPKEISLWDLHDKCKNKVTEENLIGTLFAFNVTIKEIEYSSSYKYKISCYDEFGFWLFDNLTYVSSILYTDDDSFAKLSPPCKVRVKGYFEGTGTFNILEFTNCELLSH